VEDLAAHRDEVFIPSRRAEPAVAFQWWLEKGPQVASDGAASLGLLGPPLMISVKLFRNLVIAFQYPCAAQFQCGGHKAVFGRPRFADDRDRAYCRISGKRRETLLYALQHQIMHIIVATGLFIGRVQIQAGCQLLELLGIGDDERREIGFAFTDLNYLIEHAVERNGVFHICRRYFLAGRQHDNVLYSAGDMNTSVIVNDNLIASMQPTV